MNRKLHNTASALMVTGTLFALGLAAYLSDAPAAHAAPASPIAVAAAAGHIESRTPASVEAATPSPRHGNGRTRRIRQSMAMPFFSFASRG